MVWIHIELADPPDTERIKFKASILAGWLPDEVGAAAGMRIKVKGYGLEELKDFLKAFFFAFKESKTHVCFSLGKNLNKLSLSIDLYELKIYSLLGLFEFLSLSQTVNPVGLVMFPSNQPEE